MNTADIRMPLSDLCCATLPAGLGFAFLRVGGTCHLFWKWEPVMSSRFLNASRPQSARGFQFEQLEDRRLMAVTLGVNAIVNPGAESNTGSASGNDVIKPTGWTTSGNATVVKYGASGFPASTSPGPSSRGSNFFAGGPVGSVVNADLFQTLDVSSFASQIDAAHIKFALGAFLGGFSSQNDQATLSLNF